MATITVEMRQKLWKRLYTKGRGKADMQTGPLPETDDITAIFQAIEDRWDGNFNQYKAAMVAAQGGPMTDEQANAYLVEWLQDKADRRNA